MRVITAEIIAAVNGLGPREIELFHNMRREIMYEDLSVGMIRLLRRVAKIEAALETLTSPVDGAVA